MTGTSTPTAAVARRSRSLRVTTVVTAAVFAVAEWLIAGPIAGVSLEVNQGDGTMTVGPVVVVVVSALVAACGLGVHALLERHASQPRRWWIAITTTVLVISMAGPIGAVETDGAVALAAMHVAVFLIVLFGGFMVSSARTASAD